MNRVGRGVLRKSTWGTTSAWLAGLWLAGCGRPAFPQDLFTIGASDADYPVMLSQVPKTIKKQNGRALHAVSGTHASVQQSSYSTGNTTVTVTQTQSGRSELSAATKLAAQVQRRDRWICIDNARFEAMDFATYGASSADRKLLIDGSAYR